MGSFISLLVLLSCAFFSIASGHADAHPTEVSNVEYLTRGFLDATLGWAYPLYTQYCIDRGVNVLFISLHVFELVLHGELQMALSTLQDLYDTYSFYPRCNYFVNIPVTAGALVVYREAAAMFSENSVAQRIL